VLLVVAVQQRDCVAVGHTYDPTFEDISPSSEAAEREKKQKRGAHVSRGPCLGLRHVSYLGRDCSVFA